MIKLVHNLKFRVLSTLAFILILLFYSFGYVIVHSFENSYRQSLEGTLFTLLKDIKHDYNGDKAKLQKSLNEVADEFDVPLLFAQTVYVEKSTTKSSIELRSEDIKGETLPLSLRTINELQRSSASAEKIIFETTSLPKLTHRTLRLGTLILESNEDSILVIQCALPYEKHNQQIQELIHVLTIGFTLLLGLILILVYWIIGHSFYNVQKITDEAKKQSSKITKTMMHKSYVAKEIDDLIETFNTLLYELQHAYAQVKQFGQNASHELKTPLTIMKSEIEVGLRKKRSMEEYETILHHILTEVDTLQDIIEKILFLSNHATLELKEHFEEVYIDEILLEILEEKRRFADEKGVVLHLKEIEPLTLQGHPKLLKIAIANLVDNAIKYSFASKTITISLKEHTLCVHDEGIGIPQEALEHIFEPFFRAHHSKNSAQGSGLGLSLVKMIFDLHAVRITIESKLKAYTNVYVKF